MSEKSIVSETSAQLSFELPVKTALGRDDFFVTPANAMAAALIDRTDDLPHRRLVITGPAGAGKTHLTHVWAGMHGAVIMAAPDLAKADVPALSSRALAVEDVPAIAGNGPAEANLFHLLNLAAAAGLPLLMTGRDVPSRWGLALPDLKSRVQAATYAAIDAPDDALLMAVLIKLFTDRQLSPRPDVIPYILLHMERSFQDARRVVDALDRRALDHGRNVTRRLAVDLLGGGKAKV